MLYYYPLLALPLAIVGLPLYIYLPTFYTVDVGIDIALVGLILFIARLTDVITDPLLGYFSDKSLNHFGSRKPMMILGFFILIICFYFLVNPLIEYKILWLFIFSIFIYLGWSMVNIPYLTFSSELSDDYYEKIKLNSYREIFTIIGLLIALMLPYFLSVETIEEKLNLLFYTFLFLFTIFFIITMIKLKTKHIDSSSIISLKKIKTIYLEIPKLKELHIGYFLNNLANAIPATLFLLFTQTIIKDENNASLILILYFLAGVIALPFWTLISKKYGKKTIWMSSIILASISFIFVIFLEEGDIIAFGIISFISGLSLGADIAFPTSVQSDIAQKSNDLGENISAFLFGIWTMISKLSLALSVVISFGILGLVGFDKENLNEVSALTITLLYGVLPVLLKLMALVYIMRFKENS